MTIERRESLFNIEIHLSSESQVECDLWLNYLNKLLSGDKINSKGTLKLSAPPQNEMSTLYWLRRALSRNRAEAYFYDVKNDSLIPHNWKWTKEGQDSAVVMLPIVPVGAKKTLFLDRDGVINIDDEYVFEKEKFYFMPGVFELLEWAKQENYQIIVLTNQSGVGRGLYEESDVVALHQWVDEQLKAKGFFIDGWFYSPYHPESSIPHYKRASYSRKPSPGMAIQAGEELSIDFENSFMIGDKISDCLNELDIPTFYIQGSYDLKKRENIFKSHSELVAYLKEK